MKSRPDLAALKQKVQSAFQDGPPNGWLLGWPADRFFDRIRAASPLDHEVVNDSSFDYAFCNSFRVRPRDHKGSHRELIVKISFIADVFCLYWIGHSQAGKVSPVAEAPEGSDDHRFERRLATMLAEQGFDEFPAEWYETPLDGIELELAGEDGATLDKCLFDDFCS